MAEPEKPFACGIPDCGMTFTNEDHLNVHTKKHDMMLLGLEQKGFVADQTPTPTRFIRNCEDLGIFQDLQNVNPFDEGFKQAMETAKHGILSLENASADPLRCHQLPDHDVLHTPQFIDPRDTALYTSNQRNITISRSSSDESSVIKEYETTTISKLTNEVTTISRIVNKHDVIDKTPVNDDVTKPDEHQNDVHNETSVSYTNNVIKIHNNIEIRKDNSINVQNVENNKLPANIYDTVIKDTNSIITKDVLLTDGNKNALKVPPIMSQKSLDFVVETLTSDLCRNDVKKPSVKLKPKKPPKSLPRIAPISNGVTSAPSSITEATTVETDKNDDYEVIIKLPNGKQVRMKAVEEVSGPEKKIENNTKEKLKLAINNKVQKNTVFQRLQSINTVPNILPISTGTLIPVTIVNSNGPVIPIAPFNTLFKPNQEFKKTVKRKNICADKRTTVANSSNRNNTSNNQTGGKDGDDDCVIVDEEVDDQRKKKKEELDSRVAASRRYRVRLRETMTRQVAEIKQLKEANQKLAEEKASLQLVITEHMRRCPDAFHLRATAAKFSTIGQKNSNSST